MKKTEEKNFLTKKNILIVCGFIVILLIIILFSIFSFKSSNKLKLSEFEKKAIYGYFESYLSLDKLYSLSGNSYFDELQYTQSKIKQALDSYYFANNVPTIPTSEVSSILQEKYGISTNAIDYHGIIVSDYEYIPEDNCFRRVDGANRGMSTIENQVQNIVNDKKISVQNIEKSSNTDYIIYFDIISANNAENLPIESGNVTIKLVNNTFELENCNINT